ncbi:MAG: bifunctional UDP-N-acetylglucosamine diphosphorylase/glucosamine-1-phosphate N-acetyltransferase GlmU [Campylobacter sp.]|nr:bifunctional UDP-N-acetylglucosamine diphosphorylase/glucosamine-1-phosphate N-acetyltransferase GlmU [Campylobacter sp.]
MNDIEIVVLAAGFGTRMKSQKAKVLAPLSGEAMIIHVLNEAYKVSQNVSVILSHQIDEIKDEILSHYPNTKIYKQDIDNYPGTAGALKDIKFSAKKTVILCGDMPLIQSSDIDSLSKIDADITLSVFKTDNPNSYGRVILDGENIQKIVEQKDASEKERLIDTVNGGCYCFDSKVLTEILPLISNQNAQNEYYLTDAIEIAVKKGLICKPVMVDEENFMGINDKFALSVAEEIMQRRIKKALMLSGVYFRLPQTSYIDIKAKFEGECIVEENVSIIGECYIKNSIIKSSSVVEFSEVIDSDIGPMAHLRPKSSINKTHIGNFVELKNAKLDGVKAGHLSYLGDCLIGSGTNVGCGTITCNYDGIKKYQTIIGKNVFIGSDTQIVAPVNIADDTLIAAGSTITKDIPKGALAISRTAQSNKDGYFYKFFKDKKC